MSTGLDKALAVQRPVIQSYVNRARASDAQLTPAELVTRLERQYTTAVTSMGALAGASAAVPGVGTAAGAGVNLAEVVGFLEASTLFVLAVAEVYGLPVDDPARRRALVTATLLGESGGAFVNKAAGRTAPYWARTVINGIPATAINSANKLLGPRFITRWGTRQGVLVLGRELPFGLGALIGGAGNAGLARLTVRTVRSAFGPPPNRFDPPSASVTAVQA